ncbi:MAG: HNH endonuclease signature motif containing protein, partial [Acidimicrobiia bacterium]
PSPGPAPHCVFPGCRRPARSSELDHTTRYAEGGPTLEGNLAPLCTFHHRAKDEGGWRYRRRPNGDHHWTSPHGHTYVTSGRSP